MSLAKSDASRGLVDVLALIFFSSTARASSSSIGLGLSLSGKGNNLDINMTRVFKSPEPAGSMVDLSWCLCVSFDSLHVQQIFFGNNTGLYFEKAKNLFFYYYILECRYS